VVATRIRPDRWHGSAACIDSDPFLLGEWAGQVVRGQWGAGRGLHMQ